MRILRLLLLIFLTCVTISTMADDAAASSQTWQDQGPELILTPSDSSSGQFQDEPISPSAPEMISMSPIDPTSTVHQVTKQTVSKSPPQTYGPTTPQEHIWELSQKLRPNASISVQQMMVALLRANPTAFSENNINSLRVGATLQIPSLEQIQQISPALARQIVAKQNKQWQKLQISYPIKQPKQPVKTSVVKKPATQVLFPDPSQFTPASVDVTPTVAKIDMTVKAPTVNVNNNTNATIPNDETKKLEQQLAVTQQQFQTYQTQVNAEIITLEKQNADLQALVVQDEKLVTELTKEEQNKNNNAIQPANEANAPILPSQLSAYLPKSKVGWWILWAMLFLIALVWMPSGKRESKKRQEPIVSTDNAANTSGEEIKLDDDYDFMGSQEALPAKLDLARAYIDMDDFSSAETLLREVMEKGNTGERKQAQQLLKTLKILA